ncbi:MAG: hypothetical protein ACI867_001559 [Glaciecola sp.]|jgi:hypothetical protein
MDPVTLDDLTLDLPTWAQQLETRRPQMIAYRADRRVELGDLMVLDFEDRTTVAWQVNRMIGVENIVDHEKINHELATYNVLVPGYNELCATLLIGIDDMQELYRWKPLLVGINDKLTLTVDGSPAILIGDDEGTREGEPPMVQYLKWILTDEQADGIRGDATVLVGVDHPNYAIQVPAAPSLREAMRTILG